MCACLYYCSSGNPLTYIFINSTEMRNLVFNYVWYRFITWSIMNTKDYIRDSQYSFLLCQVTYIAPAYRTLVLVSISNSMIRTMTCNLHSLQYKTEKWPKSCWFCQLDDDLCLKNQKLNFSPLILLILMSAQRQTSMVKTLVVLVWHYIRFMVADYRTILQSFHFNQSATKKDSDTTRRLISITILAILVSVNSRHHFFPNSKLLKWWSDAGISTDKTRYLITQ